MSKKQTSLTSKVKNQRWPEGAIVYQIYPRSFYDSNKDGIGDIPGVTQKLDYIKSLGVNAIWLSPFYTSPMADFGYDVADYCDVDPIFGNLSDMKALIKDAHDKHIKIMVDLVPNHSSSEHPWFEQSRQSREGKYADWYIWKDPKGYDKKDRPIPPNNWIAVLDGECAWEWEPLRQQFYLHSFDVRQPDLNWTNPDVREAIKDVMRFWLDMGVDGFRVDAVHFMAKDPLWRNEPKDPTYEDGMMKYARLQHPYNHAWPQVYAYLSEMAEVLKEDQYKDSLRFMVTEAYPDGDDTVGEYMLFYQGIDPKVAAPFNFEGLSMQWRAGTWKKFLDEFHTTLDNFSDDCVASYAFGNHDQHRMVTRLGVDRARAAAVMLLTLPGMAFIYNGEEIGMKNVPIPKHLKQDPADHGGGRDPERTPMQWDSSKNAGFSEANNTWLPVAKDYETHNVETESKDYDSFLSLYRFLGKLRNESPSIKRGSFKTIETGNKDVLGYVRKNSGESYAVFVNFSDEPCKLDADVMTGEFVISSDAKSKIYKDKKPELLPHEAVVLKIS